MLRGGLFFLCVLYVCVAQETTTAASVSSCECNKLEKEIKQLQAEIQGLGRELKTYKGEQLEEVLLSTADVAAHLKKLEASVKATRVVEESLKPGWIGTMLYWLVTLIMVGGIGTWGAVQFNLLTAEQVKEYVELAKAKVLELVATHTKAAGSGSTKAAKRE